MYPRNPIDSDEAALLTLNTLASKLRAERIANGALTIEQDEMRFRLDEHGILWRSISSNPTKRTISSRSSCSSPTVP